MVDLVAAKKKVEEEITKEKYLFIRDWKRTNKFLLYNIHSIVTKMNQLENSSIGEEVLVFLVCKIEEYQFRRIN